MNNDFQSSSRSGYRAKRKKTNLLLNSLIIIVFVIIVFVAYSIFSSGNDKSSSKSDVQNTAVKQPSQKKQDNVASKEASTTTNDSTTSDGTNDTSNGTSGNQQSGDSSTGNTDNSQTAAANDGSSTNVTENPDWKSVGTTQSGSHTPVYDTSSQDWKEMLNAISYATGLDQNNMIVWHLGRDRSAENASVGTVSSKDKKKKFTVYIQWVDGQGWKPTKVEQVSDTQNGN